jgi:hypothetical protein
MDLNINLAKLKIRRDYRVRIIREVWKVRLMHFVAVKKNEDRLRFMLTLEFMFAADKAALRTEAGIMQRSFYILGLWYVLALLKTKNEYCDLEYWYIITLRSLTYFSSGGSWADLITILASGLVR